MRPPARPSARALVRRRAGVASLAVLLVPLGGSGCLTDPPLPAEAERFAPPPAYARWWVMTEACSGVTRPLDAVQFYRVPNAATVPTRDHGDAAAYWSPASDRIVVAGAYAEAGSTVRHEMLHALLRAPGHPRAAFLGRCGGVVACEEVCLTDAGPAPAPDARAIPVGPGDLEVTAEVAPAAPSLAVDGGLFTVRVHNPKPYPVVVVPPAAPPGRAASSVRYQLTISGPPGTRVTSTNAGASDPTGYAYAAGETRRLVYDLSLAPGATGWDTPVYGRAGNLVLGPGRYVLTGWYGKFYGGRGSDSAVVTFAP